MPYVICVGLWEGDSATVRTGCCQSERREDCHPDPTRVGIEMKNSVITTVQAYHQLPDPSFLQVPMINPHVYIHICVYMVAHRSYRKHTKEHGFGS